MNSRVNACIVIVGLIVSYLTKIIEVYLGFSPANLVVLAFFIANFYVGKALWPIVLFIGCLFFSAFVSLVVGVVETGVNSEPFIEEYSSLKQLLVGVLYECRFIFVFYAIVFSRRIWFSGEYYALIVRAIFLILCANASFSVYEYYEPSFHNWLSSIKGAYGEDFSFVYRGISPLLNVYDAAFSISMLAAVSAMLFHTKNPILYASFLLLLLILQFMLGTRVGVLALVFYCGFFYLLRAVNPVVLVKNALLVFLLGFTVLSIVYMAVEEARVLIDSVVTLSDSAGSIEQHHRLFYSGIGLMMEYPFGVGVGRANFAAAGNSSFYNPESFFLALAIDIGLLGCVAFYAVIYLYVKKIRAYGRGSVESAAASLVLSYSMVSLVNIQIFYSIFITVFLSVIGVCAMKMAEKVDE